MTKTMDEIKKFLLMFLGKERRKAVVYQSFYLSFFILFFVYYEITFQAFIFHELTKFSFIPILFSICYGCIIQLIYKHVKKMRWNYIIGIFCSLISLIYMIQFYYYKIFFTFLSIYSMGAVGLEVAQFYSIIIDVIGKYIFPFLLFLLPLIIMWLLLVKVKLYYAGLVPLKKYRCFYGIAACFTYILILIATTFVGNDTIDPYELLKKEFVMDKGVRALGLVTSVVKNTQDTIVDVVFHKIPYVDEVFQRDEEYASEIISKPQIHQEYKDYMENVSNSMDKSQASLSDGPKESTIIGDVKEEIEVINVDTSPQILPINFYSLAQNETNKKIKDIHLYMEEQIPTNKNQYTGMFEGYNLIMITAEGFSPYAVDSEITPTLYRLIHEGFVFNNFYTPLWWASTIDGEYVATTSLLPKQGVISFNKIASNALPFALGTQFSNLGYESRAYHNHSYKYYKRHLSHTNLGYDYKGVGNGLNITKTWPNSDYEMMEVTIPEYIDNQPFHTYYMTISGHMNYNFSGNNMSNRHKDKVSNLPYSMEARAYIACNIELDLALEKLITSLEEKGIAEKTVIALSADHYPYGLEKNKIDEIAGHEVEENYELYKNHFILWSKSIKEPIIIDKASSSLDIIPTLSNLFNLPYDSRLFIGKDILSNSTPVVIFANGSFITDKVRYDGRNGKVTYLTDEIVSDIYIQYMKQEIKKKFLISDAIVQTNYYDTILPYMGK